MKRLERLGSAGAALAIALFAACGGKVVVDTPSAAGGGGMGGTGGVITTGPPPPDGIVSSSTGPATTVVSSVAVSTSVGVGGAGGGAGCTQAPDCFQCCADQNPVAYQQFVDIVVKFCACGDPTLKCFAPCSDPNQNTCADPQSFGEACIDCINEELSNGNGCGPNAQMTCMADPSCAPLFDCFGICQ